MHVIQLNIYCHIKTGAGRSKANNIAYNTIHITSYKKELYKMYGAYQCFTATTKANPLSPSTRQKQKTSVLVKLAKEPKKQKEFSKSDQQRKAGCYDLLAGPLSCSRLTNSQDNKCKPKGNTNSNANTNIARGF